jgi:hypothetical protein
MRPSPADDLVSQEWIARQVLGGTISVSARCSGFSRDLDFPGDHLFPDVIVRFEQDASALTTWDAPKV